MHVDNQIGKWKAILKFESPDFAAWIFLVGSSANNGEMLEGAELFTRHRL